METRRVLWVSAPSGRAGERERQRTYTLPTNLQGPVACYLRTRPPVGNAPNCVPGAIRADPGPGQNGVRHGQDDAPPAPPEVRRALSAAGPDDPTRGSRQGFTSVSPNRANGE
jgi:hypothetical protein